ncbi:HD domain-containing protein [Bacteroidales bacterium OttesenSCG-928-I21]|nr:HD domain-containing protein [Bacteroidales bacterium OttesenSCG-928-I21]
MGQPSIKNFSPKDYSQESQNFCIAQDTNKIMYFGNANGIMQFDNSQWITIKTNGAAMLDINSKNEVFFGSYNQLGKVILKDGQIKIETFEYPEDYMPKKIRKVAAFDDKVFFLTEHQLLKYENGIVDIELSNAPNLNIYKYGDRLSIYIPGRGLYFWNNYINTHPNSENDSPKGSLKPYPNMENKAKSHIEGIIQISETEMLVKYADEKGFYKYYDNKLSKFNTEVDNFIDDNTYSCGAILKNRNIIIGTKQGGIVCIDENGDYLYSITNTNGLRDNHITDVFVSNTGNLWLTSYNGISLLETRLGVSFFNANHGLNGVVISTIRYNGYLYVGTSDGLFKLTKSTIYDKERKKIDIKSKFEKINEINTTCWQLQIIENQLYAITNNGLFRINSEKIKKCLDGSYKSILQTQLNTNKYLLGNPEGVLIVSISKEKIDTIGQLKKFSSEPRTLVQDIHNNIWLGTNSDGLYKINSSAELSTSTKPIKYHDNDIFPKKHHWIDVFNTFLGPLFSTKKGVFRYNYLSDKFYPDTLLNIEFNNSEKYLYPIVEDQNKNLWYSCVFNERYERETGVLAFDEVNKKYNSKLNTYPQLREYTIENIYPENNGIVWFGTSDALIRVDTNLQKNDKKSFPCLIRKVSISKDSIIYLDTNNTENSIKKAYEKTIRFDFSATSYSTIGNVEYQYMLDGLDKTWSDWSEQPFKEYTPLFEGRYTFRVRARDIFENQSEETKIDIHILPPIYRSIFAYIAYLLILVLIIYFIVKYNLARHVKERKYLEKLVKLRTIELEEQKGRVESLIRKLLPQSTASELQETGNAKTKKYEHVSVLFADIEKFTEIAEQSNMVELIDNLKEIFMVFDKIIANYNIQKIKTIGDAYMCAAGMPTPDNTNPIEAILAALEMQRALQKINEKNTLKLKMRIGIHTGPVVAGVVGESKIEYDIWGDTVNIASRMEKHGLVGQVNISSATHHFTKDFFNFKYRGKIEVKYKGEMKMYFIDEIKPELTDNKINPNKKFKIKLQDIKYKMIENEILQQLQTNLPESLYYHNVKHTTDVIYIVEDIATKEQVTEEEMLLLKCAALFHDTGFMVSYEDNEKIAAKLAGQTLEKYNFSKEQIETVKRLILATKMPPNPKDHLEKIICDADLDYLGRPDFIPVSQNLFRELFEREKINTITQWNRMQYKFVREHSYFTETAKKNREPGKLNVLKSLEEII